jgi:hypothetical protein
MKTIIVNELSNIVMTVNVQMSWRLKWRLRLAVWLITRAARLVGAEFKLIEVDG